MTVALREVALMLLCASRDLPVLGDQNRLELATVANRKTILRHTSSSSVEDRTMQAAPRYHIRLSFSDAEIITWTGSAGF